MIRLPFFIVSLLLLHLIPQEPIKNSIAQSFRFHDSWRVSSLRERQAAWIVATGLFP